MKKVKISLLVIYIFSALVIILLPQNSTKVSAASCNTSGVVGTVNSSISVPASGEYILWVRMLHQSQAQGSMLVEVEGDTCFSVGSNNLPLNQWTWVNYQDSTTTNIMKYTFNSSGSKTVKFLFKNYTTQLDKMIILGSSEICSTNGSVPNGDGSNCALAPAVSSPSSPSNPSTPSVPISTIPESIPPEEIEKVEYYLNGELVQDSQGAAQLDVSNIEDGNYELTTKITKKDGTVEEIKQAIQVKDNQVLSPESSTAPSDNNKKFDPLALSLFVFVVLGSGIAAFIYIRKYRYHQKLYKQHHGLINDPK
jgi:hypothetical protein